LHRIDGTATNRLGRYVNDAKSGSKECNSKMKLVLIEGYPRLCLFATCDITEGVEIRYDYGDDDENLYWRHKVRNC